MGDGSAAITDLILKKKKQNPPNFSVMSLHFILQKFKKSNGHKEHVVLSQVCLSEQTVCWLWHFLDILSTGWNLIEF